MAELLFIAVVGTREWLRWRAIEARWIEESRTREAPLRSGAERPDYDPTAALMGQLAPLRDLGGDGLRFLAQPTFSRDYGVVLRLPHPGAPEAQGVLTIFDARQEGEVSRRAFTMPAPAYRALMQAISQRTDGWPGSVDPCRDGTPMAFERVRGPRITSGEGNCDPHYEAIKLLMLNAVRRYAPGDDLPTEDDWHRSEPEDG